MLPLTEILYSNNVLFSYYGFIDREINQHVLSITKNKLEKQGEPLQVVKRVYNAINECVENIIKHHFFPEDESLNCKSMLLVYKQNDSYVVDTINVITSHQKNSIIDQMDYLKDKSRDELKVIKASLVSNGQYSEKNTAGLGLVDMVLRTDSYNYEFKDYRSNFLFNINFKINSPN